VLAGPKKLRSINAKNFFLTPKTDVEPGLGLKNDLELLLTIAPVA